MLGEKKKSCWLTNVRFEQWKASGPLRNRRGGAAPPTVPHLGESVRIAHRHRIGSERVRGRLKEHTASSCAAATGACPWRYQFRV